MFLKKLSVVLHWGGGKEGGGGGGGGGYYKIIWLY